MIVVGMIDDGIDFIDTLNIAKSIEITSKLQIKEITKSDKLKSKHGITCAAIIMKYFPEVIFKSIKILDARMNCTKEQLIKAIEWCIANKIKIINISLGTTNYRDFEEIKAVINRAYKQGIIIIAACNNKNIFTYPASCPNVIGVKASETLNEGEYIFNLYPLDGIEITSCSKHKQVISEKTTIVSNSYAAPMITAEVCKILEKSPRITFEDLKKKLFANSINYKRGISIINNYRSKKFMRSSIVESFFKDTETNKKEIDVPLILVLGDVHNNMEKVLQKITCKFRRDGYYAVSAYTKKIGVVYGVEYIPISKSKSIYKLKDKVESLYGVYDCDVVILGIGIKKYLKKISTINNILNPDKIILLIDKTTEKVNTNIEKIQADKSFIMIKQKMIKKNSEHNIFQYKELDLLYQKLLSTFIDC